MASGTVIVTGANGGLGSAIARNYFTKPESTTDKALFGVRNPDTANVLKGAVKGQDAGKYEIVKLDIGTLDSTREAAKTINARVRSGQLPPIRALILNAAVQFTSGGQKFTNDGYESTFAVNFLHNWLLILLLLESFDKANGRIVIIASWTHDPHDSRNNIFIKTEEHKTIMHDDLSDLAKPKQDAKGDAYAAGMRRYGASKTLIITVMYELQRRLSASADLSNISVLAVDPGGMLETDLFRDTPFFLYFILRASIPLMYVISWFKPNGSFRTTTKSANDALDACFDTTSLGKFPKAVYMDGSVKSESTKETRDEGKQRNLWATAVQLSKLQANETALKID